MAGHSQMAVPKATGAPESMAASISSLAWQRPLLSEACWAGVDFRCAQARMYFVRCNSPRPFELRVPGDERFRLVWRGFNEVWLGNGRE